MTKEEFVERIKLIRKDHLKISQSELAQEVGSTQALVSRFELKGKGTIDFLIDVLNFYEKKGIKNYMLFLPNFSTEMLTNNNSSKSEIAQLADDVVTDVHQLVTKVKSML